MSEKEVELLKKMIIKSIELLRKLRKLRDQIRLECNKEQVLLRPEWLPYTNHYKQEARAMSEAEYKDSELKRFHDRICGMDDISLN